MKKKYFVLLILSSFLIGCIGYYRIPKNKDGERVLNDKVNYKFTKIPNDEDLIKIDTSAYYVQIFEGRYYNDNEKKNPSTLIFHNDGFFKQIYGTSYFLKSSYQNKNSVYYGGKYRIIDNLIELEKFYPSQGGKTNYYFRKIQKGKLVGNRIIFDDKFSLLSVYQKKSKPK